MLPAKQHPLPLPPRPLLQRSPPRPLQNPPQKPTPRKPRPPRSSPSNSIIRGGREGPPLPLSHMERCHHALASSSRSSLAPFSSFPSRPFLAVFHPRSRRGQVWPPLISVLVAAIYGRPNEISSHQFPPKITKYHHKNTFLSPKRVQPII